MSVHTSVSRGGDEGVLVRGYPLVDLIGGASFAEAVHLLLRGELPDPARARLLEAIIVSSVDHGINAPSIHVARAQASCGVPLSTAVAAGIASIGTHHGGAGEACAKILQEGLASLPGQGEAELASAAARLVEGQLAGGRNLPGFGHRVYKASDPRSDALFSLAENLKLIGPHARLALLMVEALERQKGKRLVLNIDGAQAALLSDMGFPWTRVSCLFIIGRTAGLCAHVAEEIESGKPLGYLKEAVAEEGYDGASERRLDEDRAAEVRGSKR